MEPLESRQLLSAGVMGAAAEAAAVGSSRVLVPARASTPSIVGTFTGTATRARDGRVSAITLKITAQTRRNVFYGTLTVRGHHGGYQYYSTTGSISGRSFTAKFTGNGITGSLTGTSSADGKTLTGKYSATGSATDSGTFSLKR